ncbi:MAG: NUDIX hydrolase [Deltaproteobacteria bacterium]|nr:NUDIX hydrolase [Deltaproteobacteria bacterium]
MKITGYKKITHKKWLNLFEVAYVDKNGQPKTWEVVSRKTTPKCITGDFIPPDAVVIVPFHRTEKKMVIIREYRVALAGFEYSLPAGLIDKEESIETASCRELKEETGLDITEILKISPSLNATAGMTDENLCMVYCQCEGSATAAGNKGTETIETILVSPEDAAVLLADTKVRFDVKLWLELSRFAEGDGIPAKE